MWATVAPHSSQQMLHVCGWARHTAIPALMAKNLLPTHVGPDDGDVPDIARINCHQIPVHSHKVGVFTHLD